LNERREGGKEEGKERGREGEREERREGRREGGKERRRTIIGRRDRSVCFIESLQVSYKLVCI